MSYNDYNDNTLQSKYTALEKQNRALKELASDQTLQVSKLVQEKGEAENQVYNIQAKATRYQHEIQELRRDNERLRSGGRNGGTIGNNNDNRELEELNKKYLALTLSSSKFEAEARDYEQIIEAFKANKDELIDKIESLEGQVSELKAKEFKDKQQAYHESQTTNVHNNQETQDLQRQVAQLKVEKHDLQGQVAELQRKAKQPQQKEALGSHLLASQELQRYKDYSAQMRTEIEQASKILKDYRHGGNSAFIDNILTIFKGVQQPPPSSPSPTIPHASRNPHSTLPRYPTTNFSGASTYSSGNPPYYPSTPSSLKQNIQTTQSTVGKENYVHKSLGLEASSLEGVATQIAEFSSAFAIWERTLAELDAKDAVQTLRSIHALHKDMVAEYHNFKEHSLRTGQAMAMLKKHEGQYQDQTERLQIYIEKKIISEPEDYSELLIGTSDIAGYLFPNKIKCFISYAWEPVRIKNAALQTRLIKIKEDLEKSGIEVMLDIHNMEGDINRYMIDGIQASDRVLLICTPRFKQRAEETSQTPNNLQKELEAAVQKQKVDPRFIIPLILDGDRSSSVVKSIENILSLDFTDRKKYCENMVLLTPKGLLPMILGLERNRLYAQLLRGYLATSKKR